MIYRLPERISKETLYWKILPDLTQRYKAMQKDEEITISLVQTLIIHSNALPLLVGMLHLLKRNSGKLIYLELAYTPKLLAFLDSNDFFYVLSKNNIIYYDNDYIGGLSDYNYNRNSKILSYAPVPESEKNIYIYDSDRRDELAENIRGDLFCSPIFNFRTTPITNDELWNTTMTTVTELVVNAMLHSGSMSYVYMKTDIDYTDSIKGNLISVVDVGHGFYESLSEKIKEDKYSKKSRAEFYHRAQSLGINVEKEINFLSILEALYYSKNQSRDMDLFKLKNLLATSHANFRIHQKNREIVFTYKRCHHCEDRDILHCMSCLWSRNKTEKTPIKAYPVSMAGVHIEVDIIQEKKNV